MTSGQICYYLTDGFKSGVKQGDRLHLIDVTHLMNQIMDWTLFHYYYLFLEEIIILVFFRFWCLKIKKYSFILIRLNCYEIIFHLAMNEFFQWVLLNIIQEGTVTILPLTQLDGIDRGKKNQNLQLFLY